MSVEMTSSGIEKGRAAFAYDTVSTFFKKSAPKNRKEYRAYLLKFPTMVLTNGLGQTLAFYYSKGETYKEVYTGLENWMRKSSTMLGGIGKQGLLIESVLKMEQEQYRLATKQLLNLVGWMSRFADGMIDKHGEFIVGRSESEGN